MDFPPPVDIDFEAALNEEQHAAVTSPPGPALVLAGAGSGKTRTLTYRVAFLLSKQVHPGSIMLLTFTNKAAKEMLERVVDLTGAETPRWGGTFHSIGGRALRMFGESIKLNPNYNILDQSDSEALMADVIRGIDGSFLKQKDNPKQKVIANLFSLARNKQQSVQETLKQQMPWSEHHLEKFIDFDATYRKRKLEQQVCDYDDLLELWLKLLREDEQCRTYFQSRFEFTLVDEYQDTNPLQAAIVDEVAANHNIMAVGDDAQCIYTWRGADFENIMTFSDRHPDTQIYKIETNYRSTPQILNLANNILANQPAGMGFSKELRAIREPNIVPCVIPVMDSRQQAQFIIGRLQELIHEGVELGNVAILYRAHYQALDVQLEFTKQGIPFQITSGIRFFEQAHIKDVVAQLRFAGNPKDQTAFMRFAMLLPKVGERTAAKLYAELMSLARKNEQHPARVATQDVFVKKVPAAAREDWEDLAQTLVDIVETMEAGKPPVDVVSMAVEGWYSSFIRTLHTNWQSRLDDLEGLLGFANRFEDMTELLSQLVLLNSETTEKNIEGDENTIRLTTVHQAKGLEFDIVFVISVGDGLFPLKRAIEEGDVEEERRLFYVAVTRAKDELYILYPMISTQGGGVMQVKPTRFLSEVPSNCYEIVRHRPARSW